MLNGIYFVLMKSSLKQGMIRAWPFWYSILATLLTIHFNRKDWIEICLFQVQIFTYKLCMPIFKTFLMNLIFLSAFWIDEFIGFFVLSFEGLIFY